MKILLALFIGLICLRCSDAQPAETSATTQELNISNQISSDTTPAPTASSQVGNDYKKSFSDKYPDATNVSWATDKNGYHEAHFQQDGEKYRVDFTDDGKWVQTEASIKYDKLPQAVKNTIKGDYDKGHIVEIEKVEDPVKGTFYDVEFNKKKGKLDIEIKPDGTIIDQVRTH